MNLLIFYNLVDLLARNLDSGSIKVLVKLRKDDKICIQYYQDHLNDFMIKSDTEVIDFVVLSDDSYKVSHNCVKDSTINLTTKIVHLSNSYTILTCNCGNWVCYFIICP